MRIGVDTSRTDNKRVFVVSGDEVTSAILTFMLTDGNETHELRDIEAAFEKGAEWKPDLLLVDAALVKAQGLSVLQDIAYRLPGAKVAIVVEEKDSGDAKTWVGAGAHAIIAHPLTIEAVRRQTDILLGRLSTKPKVQLFPRIPRTGSGV
ncbi:response regulator receiver [Rhodomicrobium vannielii ATCC 17100]|uniref:Response regulator receiver n=1 Tax=Rhodomicrobium vannielii (strain ATCC 17100 / DSM 162 / LMG 4299 / NCIMB 10020 / ATH 3.1.1) TaxID=648757 RepID=E3I0U8_RHOVT|nr:response regulator [Rhodomicrobium vannielii]ADP71188.1 response regulator receiver [Rhodomicrobium vannielii ATCC 17100]